VVTTPTASHAELIRAALMRNLHVFVEKPFALTPEAGDSVLGMLDGKPIVHQVGYALRFNDVYRQVKRLLDARALGQLLTFKMEMYGRTVLRDARNSWRSRRQEGGGCLLDFASHSVDLINYLMGVPDQVIGSVLQRIYSTHVEDAVSCTFAYRSGLTGTLIVNWSDPSYRKPTFRLEILGRNGRVYADMHVLKAFFNERPATDGFTKGWNRRYLTQLVKPVRFYVRGFEFTRQLDYFIDCIQEKRPSEVCPFEAGQTADLVIDRIRKDAERRDI
jgi:predicted dehydrogenase